MHSIEKPAINTDFKRSGRGDAFIPVTVRAGLLTFACTTTCLTVLSRPALAIPAQIVLLNSAIFIPLIPLLVLMVLGLHLLRNRYPIISGAVRALIGAALLGLAATLLYPTTQRLLFEKEEQIERHVRSPLRELGPAQKPVQDLKRLEFAIQMLQSEQQDFWTTPLSITPADAAAEFRDGRIMVLDLRRSDMYAKGHAKGAWRVPFTPANADSEAEWNREGFRSYVTGLTRVALEQKRTMVLCCFRGVTVSPQMLMVLRRHGVPALLLDGGCESLKEHGVEWETGTFTPRDTTLLAPGLTSLWRLDGAVQFLEASPELLTRPETKLPAGPLVIVTAGNSEAEKELRAVTMAMAERGSRVLGQSVTGKDLSAGHHEFTPAHVSAWLMAAGHTTSRLFGIPGLILVLGLLSSLFAASAARFRKSPRTPLPWILLLISCAGTTAFLKMADGSVTVRSLEIMQQNRPLLIDVAQLATVLMLSLWFLRKDRWLVSLRVTDLPTDGPSRRLGPYAWVVLIPAILLTTIVIPHSPPGGTLILAFMLIVTVIIMIRDMLLRSIAGLLRRDLSRDICPAGWMIRLLAVLSAPLEFAGTFPGNAPLTVRTRVRRSPGKIGLEIPGLQPACAGIISLDVDLPEYRAPDVQRRAGFATIMAARIGLDLQCHWRGRLSLPVILPQPPDNDAGTGTSDPEPSIDSALHAQLLLLLLEHRESAGPVSNPDRGILSAGRYIDQPKHPTPLTFSVLATRAGRFGPAHIAGILFGYSRRELSTVRLGARIYDIVPADPGGHAVSRIRMAIARQFAILQNSVYSGIVIPATYRASRILMEAVSVRGATKAIRTLLTRISLWQEATAISHELLSIGLTGTSLDAAGAPANEEPGGDFSHPDMLPDSWEMMPPERDASADIDIGFDRLMRYKFFERHRSMDKSRRHIALQKRAETFRMAYGWCAALQVRLIGRSLLAEFGKNGLGRLGFFCSLPELRRIAGHHKHPQDLIDTLEVRMRILEALKSVRLPDVLSLNDIESLKPQGANSQDVSEKDTGVDIKGILVSGKLPVTGIVAHVEDVESARKCAGNVIAVMEYAEPRMVVELRNCAAVVVQGGNWLCHGSMLAREFGITMLVAVSGAKNRLREGETVRILPDGTVKECRDTSCKHEAPSTHPRIVNLEAADSDCGNKAMNLAFLMAAGIPVPPGIVLPGAGLAAAGVVDVGLSTEAAEHIWSKVFRMDMGSGFIVRSSDDWEDRNASSFAGLFRSVAGLRSSADIARGVRECLEHADPGMGGYVRTHGTHGNCALSLIIQPIVPARCSGVAVSHFNLPGSGADDRVLVEVQHGVGGVVDGTGDTFTVAFDRSGLAPEILSAGKPPACASLEMLRDVAVLALRIERLYGSAQDIEWCLGDDGIWIVQSRPIVAHTPDETE